MKMLNIYHNIYICQTYSLPFRDCFAGNCHALFLSIQLFIYIELVGELERRIMGKYITANFQNIIFACDPKLFSRVIFTV